ncbi:MAG: hypothetical protein A2073_05890 [Deltaproteobacteria bacterium GWC2_42_11]|nr:MAG: hypothetical protein A2073_05890 [Deltaproteobacteria bacterium GWC2_42_11]HBO84667.1 hypothetical protein [Deltaproteobacteria bacterium]
MGKFIQVIISIIILSISGCVENSTIVVSGKTILNNIEVEKRYPLRVALVVDKKSLSDLKEGMQTDTKYIFPSGRIMPVYYRDILDRHFEYVEIFPEESSVSKDKFDLTASMQVDGFSYEISGSSPPYWVVRISGTFFIKSNNIQKTLSRKVIVQVVEPYFLDTSDPKQAAEQKYNTINSLTGTAINQFFFEFSKMLNGSPLFSKGDFKDLNAVVNLLMDTKKPVSAYLLQQFSEELKKRVINAYYAKTLIAEGLAADLINEINAALKRGSIYDKKRFEGIVLSEGTKELLNKPPDEKNRISLNRLLLEDAFAGHIEKYDPVLYETLSRFKP